MNKINDLTKGNIPKQLLKLALPIILTSFFQMAYNMTDIMWLGRQGASSVAAAGTAGYFMWFGSAFVFMTKIGVEVGVSQSIGKKDYSRAAEFAKSSLLIALIISIGYFFVLFGAGKYLISFFDFKDKFVIDNAVAYLSIISFASFFIFLNPTLSGFYNGIGDSKTPLIINGIGLVSNIILDPLLIFGYSFIPGYGVRGAAFATLISQLIVFLLFLYFINNKKSKFKDWKLWGNFRKKYILDILKIGLPVSLQQMLFCVFAIILAKIVSKWGAIPIGVQSAGAQIEALSWMTASGFSTALSSFVGQNYGAGKFNRIIKGYYATILTSVTIGLFVTVAFVFGGKEIFSLFIPEGEAVKMGIVYLKIFALSQVFMCIEITTAGAFNGLGKTMTPSIVSIVLTGLRIPMALFLTSDLMINYLPKFDLLNNSKFFSVTGVWWSVSISSVFKGVVLMSIFFIYIKFYFNKKKN